jgi:hypothetical protein
MADVERMKASSMPREVAARRPAEPVPRGARLPPLHQAERDVRRWPALLIAAPYHDGTRPLGTIGIFGPARMEYGRAIAVVETLARVLSEVLQGGGDGEEWRRSRS